MTQAASTYAYRAYLETLLNYGPAAKDCQLTASMFYKDKAGKMDVADPTIGTAADANSGLKKRYEFSKESGTIEMAGPIFLLKLCQHKAGFESKHPRVLSYGLHR